MLLYRKILFCTSQLSRRLYNLLHQRQKAVLTATIVRTAPLKFSSFGRWPQHHFALKGSANVCPTACFAQSGTSMGTGASSANEHRLSALTNINKHFLSVRAGYGNFKAIDAFTRHINPKPHYKSHIFFNATSLWVQSSKITISLLHISDSSS